MHLRGLYMAAAGCLCGRPLEEEREDSDESRTRAEAVKLGVNHVNRCCANSNYNSISITPNCLMTRHNKRHSLASTPTANTRNISHTPRSET